MPDTEENVDLTPDLLATEDLDMLFELEGLIQINPDVEIYVDIKNTPIQPRLETDNLGKYLKEIGKSSLLNREQEFWYSVDVQVGRHLRILTGLAHPLSDEKTLKLLIDDLNIDLCELAALPEIISLPEYDWGWLISEMVLQRLNGQFIRPDSLFYWITQAISCGDPGKKAAASAINLYLDLVSIPIDILVQMANTLARENELTSFLNNSSQLLSDERLYWNLDHILLHEAEAKEKLILSNLRLVVSVARKHRGNGLDFEDLIQFGNLGLMRAIEKFDPVSGYRFSTYSYYWIMQSITRAIADFSRLIRLPVHLHDRLRKIIWVRDQLYQELMRLPSAEEIADELNHDTSIKNINLALSVMQDPLSLDEYVGDGTDSLIGDFIQDRTNVEEDVARTHLCNKLQTMLNELDPRERQILELRYGLNNFEPHTLEEIGQKIGVTRERIRQIEDHCLRRLRHPKFSRYLRDYL